MVKKSCNFGYIVTDFNYEVVDNFAVFRDGYIILIRYQAMKSVLLHSGLNNDTLTRTAMLNHVMMSNHNRGALQFYKLY